MHGLKDEGLLHSALGRPVNKLAYAEPGLFDLAAAYAYGLASNHAFNDANKRTAWACCVLFLESLSRNLRFLQRERKPSKFSYFGVAGSCCRTAKVWDNFCNLIVLHGSAPAVRPDGLPSLKHQRQSLMPEFNPLYG